MHGIRMHGRTGSPVQQRSAAGRHGSKLKLVASAASSPSSSSDGSLYSFQPISSSTLTIPETSSRQNGHSSSPSTTTTTVILTEQQATMAKSAALYEVLEGVAKTGGSSIVTSTALPGLVPAGQVFVCPEESLFYSQAVEKLVLSRPDCPNTLVEFGAGDGSPIISALLKVPPVAGRAIHAYEISPASAQLAAANAAKVGLGDTYLVHNSCFWEGLRQTPCDCIISNPPYLPAPDDDIMMPGLWGGRDGAGLTRELLSAGFDTAMLLISAYSNPVLTLQHAREQGYAVEDFLCAPLPFGTYSSEPRVRQWITEMKGRGEAFYSQRGVYMLAAVLFKKRQPEASEQADLTDELLRVLTVL